MFENLANKRIMMVLPAAALLMLAGCKENEISAPAPEPVDLSQTEDLFTAPVKPNPLTTDPEAVVVRVNNEEITRGEIMELMDLAMQQIAGRVSPEQAQQFQAQIYTQIKEDLITKKLISAAVVAENIVIDDAKIAEKLEEIKGTIPEGQTIEGILEARGENLESFKETLAQDMATQELLERQTAGIAETTDEEALEFYNSNPDQFMKPELVSASHILIGFEEKDTDESKVEKKAKLEQIRQDILAGTVTFEDAAKEHSACPSSADGGALGQPFTKDSPMAPEFKVASFSQETGEVGPIVETTFGYHIIKVTDHQEEGKIEFDEVKEQLTTYLSNQKKQQAVTDFLKSLRDGATIQEIAM